MNDNKLKSITGLMCKNSILNIVKQMQEKGMIVYVSQDYRCGYPSCSEKQFFAPFIIEFRDGTAWILYSTNSVRNDRMCIQQWNAEHIKKIHTNIKKAFVVVPNEIKDVDKESKEVSRYNSKITQNKIVSSIDLIIYQNELKGLIEEYANNN